MGGRFQNFMSGRNGSDQLNTCICFVALGLVVLNIFIRVSILWYIAIVLLIVIYWRMFSRNTAKREAENDRFMEIISRFRRGGGGYGGNRNQYTNAGQSSYSRQESAERRKAQRQDRKYYCYFNCPNCNQKVRVPKGKGKIEITCPKCRTTFIRKS